MVGLAPSATGRVDEFGAENPGMFLVSGPESGGFYMLCFFAARAHADAAHALRMVAGMFAASNKLT
jgi:hypothetical protein